MSELKTSLYEEHLKLKAKMVPFAGYLMPIQYENLKKEVEAVRTSVGVFDVSHMGVFSIEGADALKAIDYLVTNDIASAATMKAIYSPLCRKDATIIDDLIVYKFSNEKIFLCVNASNIDKDFKWIEENIQNFKVDFNNLSSHYSLLAIQGPNAFETLKKISTLQNIPDMEYYSCHFLNNDRSPNFIARTGYTGEDGFEVFANHAFISNLWNELLTLGVTPCGLGARDVLRLEAGFPLYGNDLNDALTPFDTNLKWTVKLKKEDFIGKAFLETYSPKHKLIKLSLEKGIPREGYEVLDEKQNIVGKVTSGTMSVVLNHGIAMALVNADVQTELFHIDIRGKKYEAKLVKKSFLNRGDK